MWAQEGRLVKQKLNVIVVVEYTSRHSLLQHTLPTSERSTDIQSRC